MELLIFLAALFVIGFVICLKIWKEDKQIENKIKDIEDNF